MKDHNSEEDQNPESRIDNVFSEVVEHVESSSIEDLETLCGTLTCNRNAAAMVRALARRAAVHYIMRGENPPPHVRAAAGMGHVNDRHYKRKNHSALPGCKSRQWPKRARIMVTQRTYESVQISTRKEAALSRPVPAT